MTESPTIPVSIPTTRPTDRPFDPPPELAELRQRNPLNRIAFPDGHQGWLATGYATVRAILADSRFSARSELMHSTWADIGPLPPAPPGDFLNLDPPQHTRYRKLLTGTFTVRRMRLLTERVTQISTEHLNAMQQVGGPVDLVESFANPVPALLFCELLGVPEVDRNRFQRLVVDLVAKMNISLEQGMAAFGETQDYLRQLVAIKRAEPTDDLLGDLTRTDLTEDELTGMAVLLLIGGFETTANMLALGTFALLCHPAELATLRADPGLTDRAIEELMRYLTIGHTTTRSALEDVELDGSRIEAGETVALSLQAANRDPARFDRPDNLDLHRNAAGHLGFGHGIHQCLGQQLARVEMRIALPALIARFPTLRLAVPPKDVPIRPNGIGAHGVQQLPITW